MNANDLRRLLATAEQHLYEWRCTRWQWEQSHGVRFWNQYFSTLGTGQILRGEDYRNHIKAQPTEVQSGMPFLTTTISFFCLKWLVFFILCLVYSDLIFVFNANCFLTLVVVGIYNYRS